MLNNFEFVVPVRVHHGSLARARNNVTTAPARTSRSSRRRNPVCSFALWVRAKVVPARAGSSVE